MAAADLAFEKLQEKIERAVPTARLIGQKVISRSVVSA
jgi:hypothetical protein